MFRKFLDAFNNVRKKNVTPGQYLTADECISAWIALTADYVLDAIPHITKLLRPKNEWYIKETERPRMMQLYYDHFNCIDVHDQRRQGIFKIEKYWLTKTWWHRLFATVGIGMCMVDAYLAYRMEFINMHPHEEDNVEEFLSFAGKVVHSLIFNMYYKTPAATLRQFEDEQDKEATHHILRPLHTHEKYSTRERSKNTRVKLRCKMCGTQTAYYCVNCSLPNQPFTCCNPWPQTANGTPRVCYFSHNVT